MKYFLRSHEPKGGAIFHFCLAFHAQYRWAIWISKNWLNVVMRPYYYPLAIYYSSPTMFCKGNLDWLYQINS